MKKLLMLLIALCGWLVSDAQKQVVVMKKDRVIQRYNQGDFIRYSTGKPKNFKYDQIVELTDTTIITRNDTIPYYKVKLIDTQGELQSGITLRKIGYFSIVAGVILPLADLINVELVQDQPSSYSLDRGVGITSAALITTGAALLLIKKPYLKLQFKNRLMIVRQDSPLYKAITLPPSNAFSVPTH